MEKIFRVLLASIRNLTIVDGYQSWREIEHESLSKVVQARLNALENPSKSCVDVEHLLCDLTEFCGFGCQIHRTLRCFLIAYAFGRTMILHSSIVFFVSKRRRFLIECFRALELQSRRI